MTDTDVGPFTSSGGVTDVKFSYPLVASVGQIPEISLSKNWVQSINSSGAITPANPITLAAPAITRMGSGIMHAVFTSCPFPSGAPVVFTFTLWRDSTQLPPIKKTLPAGPGDDYPVSLDWVDTVTDYLPHTYSVQVSAPSGTISDSTNHVTAMVEEW